MDKYSAKYVKAMTNGSIRMKLTERATKFKVEAQQLFDQIYVRAQDGKFHIEIPEDHPMYHKIGGNLDVLTTFLGYEVEHRGGITCPYYYLISW